LPAAVRSQLETFFLRASEAVKEARIDGWDGAAAASQLVDAASLAYRKHAT
jgi:hypothetical protein